jgi:hypothetical protein
VGMKPRVFLLTCFLFLFISALGQDSQGDTNKERMTDKTCLSLLKTYSRYWIADSAGKNGLRRLLSMKFLYSCSFVDTKWNDLRVLLGSPTRVFKNSEYSIYWYRCNDVKDIKDVGSIILKVWVKNDGLIEFFGVQEVDG